MNTRTDGWWLVICVIGRLVIIFHNLESKNVTWAMNWLQLQFNKKAIVPVIQTKLMIELGSNDNIVDLITQLQ